MDDIIFETTDKTNRKIRLTKIQWSHINKKHPVVANYLEEIKEAIEKPDAITDSIERNVYFYYKYYKFLKSPYKHILVMIKYLNGEGFAITAYLEKSIK
tara:strand:+ start:2183 stop:2479 length:297 start_codon:yes stop_codon:yes gene_type:complete